MKHAGESGGSGLSFSFAGRGQMVVVTTLMLTHIIKDSLSARIFHIEGGSAKSSSIDLWDACE